MYAIKGNSYRAIDSHTDLMDGEIFAMAVPVFVKNLERELAVRLQRTNLLRLSDWTQLPDTNLNALVKQAFTLYRQALRDLPQQPTFPDIIWPTPPTIPTDAGDERPEEF